MIKTKIIFYFLLGLFLILVIEGTSCFLLYHIGLDGSFEYNNRTLFHIRKYIINSKDISVQPRYLPQHTVGWINNPRFYINNQKQNNSYGYRGEEFNLFKDTNSIRIICIGGSTTYGYGVDNVKETYPFCLEVILKNKYPKKNIEVINAGLNAASSIEELMNYQFKIRYLKPDIVIIKSAGNDAANQYDRQDSYSPDMANVHRSYIHIPAVNPDVKYLFYSYFFSIINLYVNYVGLHNQVAAKHGIVSRNLLVETSLWFQKDLNFAVRNMDYYNFYQNFDVLTDLFLKDSIQFYSMPFVLNPYVKNEKEYEKLNEFNNDIMKNITLKKGGIWMPIYSNLFLKNAWIGDDCHFSKFGNEQCSQFVSKYIKID